MPVRIKKEDGTEVVVDKDEGVRVPVVWPSLSLPVRSALALALQEWTLLN